MFTYWSGLTADLEFCRLHARTKPPITTSSGLRLATCLWKWAYFSVGQVSLEVVRSILKMHFEESALINNWCRPPVINLVCLSQYSSAFGLSRAPFEDECKIACDRACQPLTHCCIISNGIDCGISNCFSLLLLLFLLVPNVNSCLFESRSGTWVTVCYFKNVKSGRTELISIAAVISPNL